jgi:hypothetical protein
MWPDRRIREAVDRVHLRTWLPLVRAALECNRSAGRVPATFHDLDRPLDRDPRNVERLVSGKHALTSQLAIGLSMTLNIPIKQFFPETDVWLARTGMLLCGDSVAEIEMRAYVAYRRSNARYSNPHLDERVIKKIAADMESSFSSDAKTEQAILACADALGSILENLSGGREK